MVLAPVPLDGKTRPKVLDQLAALGRAAGIPVLDLFGAFSSVDDLSSLWIAPWDSHTNAAGKGCWLFVSTSS